MFHNRYFNVLCILFLGIFLMAPIAYWQYSVEPSVSVPLDELNAEILILSATHMNQHDLSHVGEPIQAQGVICWGKALWKPVSFVHLPPPNAAEMETAQLHMSQWLNTSKLSS